MLRTPATFVPLLVAQEQAAPLNFVFCGDALMVREADLALPGRDMLGSLLSNAQPPLPVGLLAGRYCQTAWLEHGSTPATGYALRKLRSLFGAFDEDLLSVAGRAYQIAEWARTHRFCGACATPTVHVPGERCARCPACGHVAYPRISPAMMVLVKRGDAILLARHTNSPSGYFTALAGFLEAGESIEDAVHREVFEEVGLRVRDVSYFGSQPWPFPHSLMIAFTAEYVSGEIVVDRSEISQARWFGPDDAFPSVPPLGLSIAGHLIHAHLPSRSGTRDHGGALSHSPR
jgi:NAD+ diphosphatase